MLEILIKAANKLRDALSEAFSGFIYRLTSAWLRTQDIEYLSKHFQQDIFLLDGNGEEYYPSETQQEKLPVIFELAELVNEYIPTPQHISGESGSDEPYLLAELLGGGGDRGDRGLERFLERLANISNHPAVRCFQEFLEFFNKGLSEETEKEFYRKLQKLLQYLRLGWQTFSKPEEVQGKLEEERVEVTGLSTKKIAQKLLQKAQEYRQQGRQCLLLPLRIEKQEKREFLVYAVITDPHIAVHGFVLLPSLAVFARLLKSINCRITWTIKLSPVARRKLALPYATYYETAHWFKREEIEQEESEQIIFQDAVYRCLGIDTRTAGDILFAGVEHSSPRTLVNYYIKTKIPLLRICIDKDALDQIIETYKQRGVEVEMRPLIIKPVNISYEIKDGEVYKKVSPGEAFEPRFVLDATLDEKKLLVYKLRLANKTFFMLRFTGKGKKDIVYIGVLPQAS
ncbi:MAG: hypothetical protein GXO42_01840 [bacterium]|nr:hypothetical protein [bacterium]